jgi:group I intron endonuclease
MNHAGDKFILYKITCTVTGKTYIGITTQPLQKRWSQHASHSNGSKTKLGRAIAKYGVGAFSIEHIASTWSLKHLLLLEAQVIAQYDSMRNGLNSTAGGDGVFGLKFSDESKLKMSVSRIEKWKDQEYRDRISAAQRKVWASKSPQEISERRERARNATALREWMKSNPKARKPEPILWKGKGWNMKIKTHCPKGHPYSPENTAIRKCDGGRECRTCKRAGRNVARNRRQKMAYNAKREDHKHAARMAAGGKKW